jgi:YaiO family outer membrane protein
MKEAITGIVLSVVLISLATPVAGLAEKPNKISVDYTLDLFQRSRDYGPWHMVTLDYSRKFPFLTFIGRINYAARDFGGGMKPGVQFEMDAYPKIRKGLYGYLNAGYSPSSIFPVFRAGLEPYFGLPWSMETSIGIRYLQFSTAVFILTGHIGKYYGNYWFSLRPFLTFKPEGLSISGIFQARRYLADADNYLNLVLGYGSSPEELISTQEIDRVAAYKAGFDIQKTISSAFLLKGGVKYEYEEYRVGEFGHRFSFSIGLAARF